MQAEAGAQTINEAVAQPVVATPQATDVVTEVAVEDASQQLTGLKPMFMFVIIIAVMYFLMIRPQRKRQKEIDNFRRGLKPGMEVVTSGGIYGKIKDIDGNVVVLEVAHNVNVRVDISVVYANPGAMGGENK